MKPFAKLLLAFGFSRKLWATAIALCYLRWDYWSDVPMLYTLTEPAQLETFRDLAKSKNDTLKYILLGYLGIEGAVQMAGGSVASAALKKFTTKPPAAPSTKDLD